MKKIYSVLIIILLTFSLVSCKKINKLSLDEQRDVSVKLLKNTMKNNLYVNSIVYESKIYSSKVYGSKKDINLTFKSKDNETNYNYNNNLLVKKDKNNNLISEEEILKEDFYKYYLGEVKIGFNSLLINSINTDVKKSYYSKGSSYTYKLNSTFKLKENMDITIYMANREFVLSIYEIYFSTSSTKNIKSINFYAKENNEIVNISLNLKLSI